MATQSNRRAPAAKAANRTKQIAAAVEPPKSAAQAEADNDGTVVVDWRGYTFTVVTDPDEWNFWNVALPASLGNIPQTLSGILGTEVMERLRQAEPNMTSADARDLYNTVERAIGFASGKA